MQLPEDFIRYTRQLMGEELFKVLADGLNEEPSVSIRINPRTLRLDNWTISRLDGLQGTISNLRLERVPWCDDGYYLSTRPNFTFDPLLHAGCYYVQEASSMFLHHVLKHILPEITDGQSPDSKSSNREIVKSSNRQILDLCAAPGGKSTLTRSLLPEGSVLYCNEPVRQRAQVLSENMQKWGHAGVVVTNCHARDYRRAGMRFDLIIADVPCSGEGMFRKDPQAVGEWSAENVRRCQRLQREIVSDIWECLNPGGYMVYSTCTFNALENEDNVSWIARELGADLISIPTDPAWNITGSLEEDFPVYRFIPGKTRGEGLFMAVLRKKQGARDKKPMAKGKKQDALNIIPNDFLNAMQAAADAPRIELTYEQALSYLRREALTLPTDTPRGIVTVCFQGAPLGLAKNIGNRANNLYPKEWRIKTTHIPNHYEAILRHT